MWSEKEVGEERNGVGVTSPIASPIKMFNSTSTAAYPAKAWLEQRCCALLTIGVNLEK